MPSLLRVSQNRLVQQFVKWGSFSVLLGAIVTLTPILTKPVIAAEQLYLTYGPIGRSIPIEDLRTFADTGRTTSQLRWYLRFANLDTEVFRRVLTQEVAISLETLDTITYTLPGEFALFQVSQVIHTRHRLANIQALRGALLVSASDGNRISLLEFLENYPTPGVYVDGVVLARVARDVGDFVDRLEPTIAIIQEVLSSVVCDCQSTPVAPTEPSN